MTTKELKLSRNRTFKTEILDDGDIGLEVTKIPVNPNYKNGDSDYHEAYFNLSSEEITQIVDFLLDTLETYKQQIEQEVENV